MPLIDKMFGLSEENCHCGRLKREIHCAGCGSFRIEGRARMFVDRVRTDTGFIDIPYRQWRCRRCMILFSDKDRVKCEAPPIGLSVKALRLKDKIETVTASMTPVQRKARLEELFGGMNKPMPTTKDKPRVQRVGEAMVDDAFDSLDDELIIPKEPSEIEKEFNTPLAPKKEDSDEV